MQTFRSCKNAATVRKSRVSEANSRFYFFTPYFCSSQLFGMVTGFIVSSGARVIFSSVIGPFLFDNIAFIMSSKMASTIVLAFFLTWLNAAVWPYHIMRPFVAVRSLSIVP